MENSVKKSVKAKKEVSNSQLPKEVIDFTFYNKSKQDFKNAVIRSGVNLNVIAQEMSEHAKNLGSLDESAKIELCEQFILSKHEILMQLSNDQIEELEQEAQKEATPESNDTLDAYVNQFQPSISFHKWKNTNEGKEQFICRFKEIKSMPNKFKVGEMLSYVLCDTKYPDKSKKVEYLPLVKSLATQLTKLGIQRNDVFLLIDNGKQDYQGTTFQSIYIKKL